jgi:hypothetical protein
MVAHPIDAKSPELAFAGEIRGKNSASCRLGSQLQCRSNWFLAAKNTAAAAVCRMVSIR